MNVLRFSSRLTRLGFRRVQCSQPAVPFKVTGLNTQYSSAIRCTSTANPPPATKPPVRTSGQRWTNEETQQFFKVVGQFTPPYPWKKIADHPSMGKSSEQCKTKWKLHNYNTWSEDEATILCELVAKTVHNPESGQLNEDDVDWAAIGKALRKSATACRAKWRAIHSPGVVERFLTNRNHVTWSAELVESLTDSVRQFEGRRVDWYIVAGQVGHGKNAKSCKEKYDDLSSKPHTHRGEQGAEELWSDEKVAMLHQLVQLHTTLDRTGETTINWTAVGKGLGRKLSMAKRKWRDMAITLANRNKDANHYSPEEDALILRHVEEWGNDNRLGLWTSLEEKLGRQQVRKRWLVLRSGISDKLHWTPDMDNALIAVRKKVLGSKTSASKRNTVQIIECMNELGWQVSAKQCKNRYSGVIKHRLSGCAVKIMWTKELTASMMELRVKGASWSEISETLLISPNACRGKYETELTKHLKQGPFSAEEDALLRQRVAEWGDPRQKKGLWVRLQKEMGRQARALRFRWLMNLSLKVV